ncbi:MAG TPA: phosphotransferase [Thermoanaerobaculia bacterium]|nr:phosphotransferase [Thermoanaerobaculia bacterium]
MNDSLPPLAWDVGSAQDFESVEALGEGDSFECYLLDGRRVVRLAMHAAASASLRREMILLPHLQRQIDVQIPNIDGSGVGVISGERFVCYPLVPGIPLTPEVLAGVNMGCRLDLIQQIAWVAAQLHSFPIELASSCGVRELTPREYLPGLLREAESAISHHLDPNVWKYHQRLVELYLDTPELQAYRPAFLHGDFSPDHLLVDATACTLTGVIDFSDCCIGDPHWDLIYILQHYGSAVLDELLTTYHPGDKHRTEQRIRIYQELNNVQYCLSMHADGDDEAFAEAVQVLTEQASGQRAIVSPSED